MLPSAMSMRIHPSFSHNSQTIVLEILIDTMVSITPKLAALSIQDPETEIRVPFSDMSIASTSATTPTDESFMMSAQCIPPSEVVTCSSLS